MTFHNESATVNRLQEELEAMVQHASGAGIEVPPKVVALLHHLNLKQGVDEPPEYNITEVRVLVTHHALMSRLVAPSKPGSLVFIQRNRRRGKHFTLLGSVPLVQFLLFTSLFFLFSIVFLALFPDVNSESINDGVFSSSGLVLFLNLSFLLACAGLGASFAALHDLNQQIEAGTYDPRFDSTYLVNLIMGVISGLIIAELLPLDSQSGIPDVVMDKPLVALLGGFSSDVIYQILRHLVLQVKKIFGKDETHESKP